MRKWLFVLHTMYIKLLNSFFQLLHNWAHQYYACTHTQHLPTTNQSNNDDILTMAHTPRYTLTHTHTHSHAHTGVFFTACFLHAYAHYILFHKNAYLQRPLILFLISALYQCVSLRHYNPMFRRNCIRITLEWCTAPITHNKLV